MKKFTKKQTVMVDIIFYSINYSSLSYDFNNFLKITEFFE